MQGQVLYEGVPVTTLWEKMPHADAILAQDGIIQAVGGYKDLRSRFPEAKRVALSGAAVIPAFNDCHCHILWLGLDLLKADLRECLSVADVQAELRAWARDNPGKVWISGRNYDQNRLKEGRHVTKFELDAVSLERPVFISHVSKHGAVANSAALRVAGVTADTPDPPGGEIVRDASGEPTGVLLENAIGLVSGHFPEQTEEELSVAVERAALFMAERGILAASDAGTGSVDLRLEWRAFTRAVERGVPVRITLMPDFTAAENAGWFELEARFAVQKWIPAEWEAAPHRNLRLGPVKLYTDGSLTARTAALYEPFVDAGTGILLMEPEELSRRIGIIHHKGFQCAAHAIGDRAIDEVLRNYRRVLEEAPRPARHRIEHCMIPAPSSFQEMHDLGVLAIAQPEFFPVLGHAYRQGLGRRADPMMPYRTWLDAGIRVAFSSDQPIVSGDPIIGWRAAVLRQGRDGYLFAPEERLDPMSALRCYTAESAYAGFDDLIGKLAPGMRADFVVLSHPPEKIVDEDMKVVAVSSDLG